MKDKIGVREFVRTNEGDIFEFGGYFKSGNIDSMTDKDGILYGNQKKCCKKHSKNIIDLIGVGDIVELTDVVSEEIIYIWDKEILEAVKQDIEEGQILKSILTREEFMNRKYEV